MSKRQPAPKHRLLIIGLVCNYIKQHTEGPRQVLGAIAVLFHFALRYNNHTEQSANEMLQSELKVVGNHLEISQSFWSILEAWFIRMLSKGRWPSHYVEKNRRHLSTHMRGSRELLPPISLEIIAVAFLPVKSSIARKA